MRTANATGELTIGELDQVHGAAMVEFCFGPAIFQFNTDPVVGGYSFWNGRNFVGDQDS
jgi:hypothetical protein